MKVLLAIDGSRHSQAALAAVAGRSWPPGTEVRVLTVVHSKWPLVGDPFFATTAAHMDSIKEQGEDAPVIVGTAVQTLSRNPALTVSSDIREGKPHDVIVQEAQTWGADLIVLGSHGYGPIRRALLGSVAAAVAVEAPSAVEIIRIDRPPVTTRQGPSS
jgi:nucleotide-binding universal stress UspA family protein